MANSVDAITYRRTMVRVIHYTYIGCS